MPKLLSVILAGGAIALTSCSPPPPQAATPAPDAVTASASTATTADAEPTYFQEDGIAIRGADPVAYFTESAYVAGSDEFTHNWQGVTWQFSSAANRDAFAATPEAYAPQYGGFCAYAVSQGVTAPVEPESWKVVDGKLYLNLNQKIQKRWEKDIPGYIASADQNWPGVLN